MAAILMVLGCEKPVAGLPDGPDTENPGKPDVPEGVYEAMKIPAHEIGRAHV